MEFKDLSPELQEKARACKTAEDIIALAKQEGYTLSDEELDSLAGGGFWGCNSPYYCDADAGCYGRTR